MALSKTTLETELNGLSLYDGDSAAVAAWAGAYKTYFTAAQSNGVPVIALALLDAEADFITAATGLSAENAAAGKITAGIAAFWAAMVAAPSAFWATTLAVTPPPGLAGLAALLTADFASNTSGEKTKPVSMAALANTIHTASLGGTANWPPPPAPNPIAIL